MWNRALATLSCAFCPAKSTTQKKRLRVSQFFCEFHSKSNSRCSMLQSCAQFADLIFPRCSDRNIFLRFFCEIMRNRALSHAHFALRTRHSSTTQKRLLRTHQFLRNAYVKSSSGYSPPHFANPKALRTSQFFEDFQVQIELLLQSCPIFVDNFCPTRPETTETWENTVSRPRIFSSLKSRVPEQRHFPTTSTSTWWCGWHMLTYVDMVRMLAMTSVRSSEVLQNKHQFLEVLMEMLQ